MKPVYPCRLMPSPPSSMALPSNISLHLLNGLLPFSSVFWPLFPICNFAFTNMNYLTDSTHKQLLDLLLASCGLSSTVQFPTRIQNNSYSAIDNVFINTHKIFDFSVSPIINGLSDHNAQNIIIPNFLDKNCNTQISFKWRIDAFSIKDFNIKLSYECGRIYLQRMMLIPFLTIFWIPTWIFYSSFHLKKVHHKPRNKAWLTPGIKNSRVNKRKPFLMQRNRNYPKLTTYYKRYCLILASVITQAKKAF